MTLSPTNEPKTAEQAIDEVYKAIGSHSNWHAIREAIMKSNKLYAHQEGRELVEALEYLLHDRNAIGLTIAEVCSKSAFDRVETAISSWKARNQ